MYNLTNLTAANNLYEVVAGVNGLSGNMFSAIFLLAVFIVLLFNIFKNDFKVSMLASTIITTLIAILMFFIGLITWQYIIICILLLIVSIILLIFTR